jgi:hypothetical protein
MAPGEKNEIRLEYHVDLDNWSSRSMISSFIGDLED